ncbi:MAG: hypothetical protein JXR51_10875 [Bacteroidales bacterium]|nr:hypothetical protein [Bacteroidales bacterium]MBN2757671.1 hypothetical protein [Bacteroidales bacterium]
MKNKLINKLKSYYKTFDEINKYKAVEMHEWQEKELRNIFALLVCGSFIGIPSPPVNITTELFPFIESDLKIMLERLDASIDPLGELASIFDAG